ncbi:MULTISPECIES: peptide chain release factor N(5)-glutamine methyltransferase [unclassified Gilliamella]|uniref:peptide chain release factor N(5)-glutamine methyltransferase n=1 Tax=unclassified Gilliamella TaxID=2685620 RepID=UPI00130BD63E|nr:MULTISPECIES: peptide chain release factor N(5)-glutamine methyltransferase [unclassified Gilliamella]MWP49605.1 peptide chain release factor N(5)-glutamine methyltransferase [Gilliamella sp. Lep-s35]MWP69370.1 peptide chain release factor N(5)-glutamine methyltransferase [Gilliamella sp. Lep-s5]MWP77639.1 peptide chain release factor N(5)-glutamine methyltransferase [Gilliamella sp. Lep-s21]
MTYLQWLKSASQTLTDSESPKRDAEILLSFVTQKTRTFLMAFSETLLTDDELIALSECLERRKNGEPIAYITGEKEFWSLKFNVSSATLIPRPDTEKLVELSLEYLPKVPCEVLDLGTGTGAIVIAMATERQDCLFTAIEKSQDALILAQQNATQIGVNNVYFLHGDWYKPIKNRKFSMIVSNPPYIESTDIHLSQGDVRYEPRSALVSGEDGLSDIKLIVQGATKHLIQYGWLLIEHGWKQGEAVQTIFKQNGFQLVETFTDYSGNDRVTLGRWFKP